MDLMPAAPAALCQQLGRLRLQQQVALKGCPGMFEVVYTH